MSLPDPLSTSPGGDEPEWISAVTKYESVLKKHDVPSSGMALAMMGDEAMAQHGKGKAFLVTAVDAIDLIVNSSATLGKAREMFPSRVA